MTIDDLIHILKSQSQAVFQVALARYLHQPGKTINDANCLGETLLISAAIRGREEAIPILLGKGAKIDQKCNSGRTPLIQASRHKHRQIVVALLKAGSKIDEVDEGAYTALMYTANDRDLEGMQFLVKKGADIEIRNDRGETVLIRATKQDFPEIVFYLLNQGVDLEKTDNEGKNALDCAIQNQADDTMEILIWKGAQIRKNLKMKAAFEGTLFSLRKTLFNLLKNAGRPIPPCAIPKDENLEEIQKYNEHVIRCAEESGKEVGKNLMLNNRSLNLVKDYLYSDGECLGIFYQAFSNQRALNAPVVEVQNDIKTKRTPIKTKRTPITN